MVMQNDEQAIRELVANWLSASAAGDTEKVLTLMSDDVVFLIAGQAPMNKKEFAASQSALKDFDLQATSDIQEIKVVGDWAYCWNKLAVQITPRGGGATMHRAGNVLSILNKQHGKWVITRDANMLAK